MIYLFVLGFALAASPGPDFFLIVRNTLSSGRMVGFLTLLGNRLSFCIHISMAIAGVSVILQTSATLFLVIRLLGAAYLLYLGAKKLIAPFKKRDDGGEQLVGNSVKGFVAMRQGFINNLLNPKVSLFFLSLFPQVATQEMLSDSPWAIASALFLGNTAWWIPLICVIGIPTIRTLLNRFQTALDILFGFIFVGFGLRIVKEEVFS